MWRRFFLALLLCAAFSSLCFASGAETLDDLPASDVEEVSGVNEVQGPQITADDLYRLVGVDPSDDEAVERFLTWLSSLEDVSCAAFNEAYLAEGYSFDGMQAAYFTYCSLHDLEPELTTVINGSGYTQYKGEDVMLTYISSASTGYPAGTWLLGTPGKTGTNGYSGQMNVLNLTEVKEVMQNVVTDANLETLNKNSNKIVDLLLEYYPQWLGTSQLLSKFLSSLDAASVVGLYDYASDGLLSAPKYINFTKTSFFSFLFNMLLRQQKLTSEGFYYLDRDLASWLNADWSYSSLYPSTNLSNNTIASVSRFGTGFISLLSSGFQNSQYAVSSGFLRMSYALLGSVPQVGTIYSYDPETGERIDTENPSGGSIAQILFSSLGAVQQDTAALRFVLADEDDIRLKASQKENQDTFEDNFIGVGGAAVKPGDIADVGSWSGSMQDILKDNPASGADFFGQLTSSGNYDFFSATTQASLDAVSNPAVVALSDEDTMDQWLEDYTFDENGFASLTDMSYFDLASFLGGGSD